MGTESTNTVTVRGPPLTTPAPPPERASSPHNCQPLLVKLLLVAVHAQPVAVQPLAKGSNQLQASSCKP
jgi:hypothetical protein